MDDELLFEYKNDPEEQSIGNNFIRDKSFSFAVAVFAVAAVGPIRRWLRELGIMNDILGYILFLFGYLHSCLVSLWEILAGRGNAERDHYTTEMVELPDLVEQDQIETPPSPNRPKVSRKLPVPPAFVNEKDYPVDWLVYSKQLGVVPKKQADRQRIMHHSEEKTEEVMDSSFIATTSPLISSKTPSSPHQQLIQLRKHRSQSDDNFDNADHISNNQFSPFMQSVVAT